MALDYSQKRLLSAPLRSRGRSKSTQRLQTYAFFTGLFSTIISLAHLLLVWAGK
ncbi:MAG: hypothetical protein WAV21_00220 [Minisyncoccia bacterium]